MLLITEDIVPIEVVYNCTVQSCSKILQAIDVIVNRDDVCSAPFIWYLTIKGELDMGLLNLCTLLQDECWNFIRSSIFEWAQSF